MNIRHAVAAIAATALLACGAGMAARSEPDAVDVRANMVEGVNPAALAIWDVGNAALNDDNGLDPAQMDDGAWAKIQEGAESLRTYAHRLATAKVIRASGPDLVGGKVPEGVASREQIQAMIDANPDGFRASAAKLEQDADALARASKARDIKLTGELVFSFDKSCQGCHENYWYRQQ
jgi:cytochrome c556